MRRLTVRIAAALVPLTMGTVIVGCGGSDHQQPTVRHRAAQPKTIYAGEVGALPAPSRTVPGPHLVLPSRALEVLGRFPLGAIVRFNVPVRNDGRRPLRISKLEPG